MALIGKTTAFGYDVDPKSPTNQFRIERFRIFKDIVDRIVSSKGHCRIIDVGGTHDYWKTFASDLPDEVSITIVNKDGEPGQDSNSIRFDRGDARDLSHYRRNAFDIVHSNSTIEHVGLWADMKRMAREVRRLAPRYFVQTPNYWFPIEPHARTPFLHFLPEPLKASLMLRRKRGFWGPCADIDQAMECVQDAALLDHRQMRFLFPDAHIHREKVLGLTKSLTAVKA